MKTRITLASLPPSVNAMWRHTAKGKTYRTKAYMGWLNAETWTTSVQLRGQTRFIGPVYVTLAMRRPRSNADLDNRIKGVLDLLQSIEAIDNDKHVMGVNAFWSADLPDGVAAEISIVQADALGEAA